MNNKITVTINDTLTSDYLKVQGTYDIIIDILKKQKSKWEKVNEEATKSKGKRTRSASHKNIKDTHF